MWAWYLEWSKIARVAIKNRALLRQLGFLSARRGEEEEETETPGTGTGTGTAAGTGTPTNGGIATGPSAAVA